MKELYLWHHNVGGEKDIDAFYILDMPSSKEPQCYIQHKSLSAFKERELKRAFPKDVKGDWVQYSKGVQYVTVDYNDRFIKALDIDPASLTRYKGVWEFYVSIGYNYKKKKYEAAAVI